MLAINLNINSGQHQHQLCLSIISKTSCPYTMLLYSGPASIFPSIHINQPQNEDFSIAFLATGLMAATANSQYTGFLFFLEFSKCPDDGQEEHSILFTYSAGNGNSCFAQDFGLHSFNISASGSLIGTNTKAPTKIGGCPTSTCDLGYQTVDVTTCTDRFTLDRTEFTDAPRLSGQLRSFSRISVK